MAVLFDSADETSALVVELAKVDGEISLADSRPSCHVVQSAYP